MTAPSPQLTPKQLRKLTGVDQTAAQIRWLEKMGLPHRLNAKGDPVLTWSVVDAVLLGDLKPRGGVNMGAVR